METKSRHVPAWKRIGLKLKHARDAPLSELHVGGKVTSIWSGNQEVAQQCVEDDRPAKKRKNSAETAPQTRKDGNGTTPHTSTRKEPTARVVAPPALLERRKSVTFTPETKQEDGFSASTSSKQDQKVVQDESVAAERLSISKSPKKKKIKRVKETHDYVQYVQLFYTDKSSWKFNKKRQTDLLKNLFNIHRIPPQQNPAILQYLAGLQGATARIRLIENATSVLKTIAERDNTTDFDSMESEEARRAAYGAALRRQIEHYERSKANNTEYDEQQLAEMSDEVERGKRAEAVLGKLLQQELYPEQTAPPALDLKKNGDASTQRSSSTPKAKSTWRKRKSRIGSIDESSSESEGDFNPSRGPATIHAALSNSLDPKSNGDVKEVSPSQKPTGKKIIFDDELLDKMFPKEKSYNEIAPKRKPEKKTKARGFAYQHGTRVDESASESEDSSSN